MIMIRKLRDSIRDAADDVLGFFATVAWIYSILFLYRVRRHRIEYSDGQFENIPPCNDIIDSLATGIKIVQTMAQGDVVALEQYKADPETGAIGELVFRAEDEEHEDCDEA